MPGGWLPAVTLVRKDVLIIGAGPSGLFAASELARHGVDARVVEREVRPHHEARATTIQPCTLEILDSVGPVRRGGAQLGAARWLRPRVETGARPARRCAPVATRRLRGGARDRRPPRPPRLGPCTYRDSGHRRPVRQGREPPAGNTDPVTAALARNA